MVDSKMKKHVNERIEHAKTITDANFSISKRTIFIILMTYVYNRRSSYRSIAEDFSISKTAICRMVDCMPIKFNDKFAKKVYEKAYYNQHQIYDTVLLSPKDYDSFRNTIDTVYNMTDGEFDKLTKKQITALLWK